MKTVFLTRKFEDGEAATEYIKAVAGDMAERGHGAVVISFDDGSHYSVDERVDVYRVGLPFEGDNLYNWSMMLNNELKRKAREVFDDEQPDLLHVIDWTALPGGVTLSRFLDIPLVVTYQSTENERGFEGEHSGLISELEWQGAFEADKALPTSEDTKNSLLFDLDVPGDKVEVIDPFGPEWTNKVIRSYKELVKHTTEVVNT